MCYDTLWKQTGARSSTVLRIHCNLSFRFQKDLLPLNTTNNIEPRVDSSGIQEPPTTLWKCLRSLCSNRAWAIRHLLWTADVASVAQYLALSLGGACDVVLVDWDVVLHGVSARWNDRWRRAVPQLRVSFVWAERIVHIELRIHLVG